MKRHTTDITLSSQKLNCKFSRKRKGERGLKVGLQTKAPKMWCTISSLYLILSLVLTLKCSYNIVDLVFHFLYHSSFNIKTTMTDVSNLRCNQMQGNQMQENVRYISRTVCQYTSKISPLVVRKLACSFLLAFCFITCYVRQYILQDSKSLSIVNHE